MEPFASDRPEEDLNPAGRVFHAASALFRTRAFLAREVGMAPGARAREERIRNVITSGGVRRFRRAAETPFNIIFYEARPGSSGDRPPRRRRKPRGRGPKERRNGWSS